MQTAGPSGPVVCILSATSKNAAPSGGVLYSISVNGGLAAFLQLPVGAGFHPRPDAGMTADPVSPHQPCRGRRPRRPFPSFTTGTAVSRGLRAAGAARKGGTPGEGSPFNPLLRFFSIRGVPRAAARGQGSAPGPRPLFCKKAGQKTFTWLDFCRPKPLAVAASDSIRPRSGHLSGRVAAPTRVGEAGGSRNLTGESPPQKRFSLGLHPVSLGKTKEMGWNRQHNLKITASKTASS